MVASLRLSSFLSTLAVTLLLQRFVLSITETTNNGFTVDLIHRDSTLSPFYNSSQTRFDRMYNAFSRSVSRANRMSLESKSSIQSNVIASDFEYLMKIFLGTPAIEVLGIVDTGSDLVWTQCEPCENCFKQNLPLFDPQQSSTYRNLSCKSNPCKALETLSGCTDQNTCQYIYLYGDGSYTNGDLGVETLTIGSTSGHLVTIPRIVFGCGHNNNGTFGEAGSGLIGLGRGSLSLISQLNQSIYGKFSYCLVPNTENSNATSKINFGSNAMVSGNGVVSTPLVAKEDPNPSFYYLTLEGISIGSKKFAYNASSKAGTTEEGNIFIDSGTTLTYIPPELYEDLVSALEKAIDAERVSEPGASLCFKSKDDIDVPIITVHFAGAELKLQPINTFARITDDVVCFNMLPFG
uniref:Peptidase A1 domain-containing protein n=1 Tax=Fagus sylvatica TaxID=28930 RepID=A0A2N9FP36_FAGSY